MGKHGVKIDGEINWWPVIFTVALISLVAVIVAVLTMAPVHHNIPGPTVTTTVVVTVPVPLPTVTAPTSCALCTVAPSSVRNTELVVTAAPSAGITTGNIYDTAG